MKERVAAKMGFMAALAVPALALGLFTPITDGKPDWMTVMGLFPIGYLYAAIFTLPLAIPAYLFARRHHLIRWWSTVITGLAVGSGVSCILRFPPEGRSVLFLSAIGGLAAGTFWLVWRLKDE